MWQHATTKWQGMAVAASILRTDCRSQLPQPPRLRASSTLVTSTLLSEPVPCCLTQSSKIHQILIATYCNCIAPKQSLNPTGPTVEWPSHIRISVGNSASRRLFAKNPSNGIISCSAPARPSVMTWARPFSVAATSSSKGFLEGSEHRLNRNKDGNMDNTDRSRKKE